MEDLTRKMEIYPPGQEHPLPEEEAPRHKAKRIAIDIGIVALGLAAFAAELAPIALSFM